MTRPSLTRLALLDWGIGGIGVLQHLRQGWPEVSVLYLSDTGATPYGRMPRPELARRVRQVLRALEDHGATHVLIACNAASTVLEPCLDVGLPLKGMLEHAPHLLPASFRGTLGILGGGRTIRSGIYRRALQRPGRTVIQRIAQPLSAHIEAGNTASPRLALDLARILRPLRYADVLVLACTHYPAIAPQLRAHAPNARIVDPGLAAAQAVLRDWPRPSAAGHDRFLTTGDPEAMRRAARLAWGVETGPCEHARLDETL
jgi:glutamate racemase